VSSTPFQASLDRFSQRVKVAPSQVVAKIALEIHDDIVAMTPRDTGRAASNWNIALGDSPDTSTTAEGPQNPAAASQAQTAKLSDIQPGQNVFITNSLPYIQALENGHSKQAPAGMVKVAIVNAENMVFQVGGSS
jgi:hypothetical protein